MRRREYISSMILMRSSISRMTSSRVSASVSAHLISASNNYTAEAVNRIIVLMQNKPDLHPQVFNLVKQCIDQGVQWFIVVIIHFACRLIFYKILQLYSRKRKGMDPPSTTSRIASLFLPTVIVTLLLKGLGLTSGSFMVMGLRSLNFWPCSLPGPIDGAFCTGAGAFIV